MVRLAVGDAGEGMGGGVWGVNVSWADAKISYM